MLQLPARMRKQALQDADRELQLEHCKGIFHDGDPNNPIYNNGINYTQLFGYNTKEFLGKQYK